LGATLYFFTGEFPPRLAAAGELGQPRCEGETKQQPADKHHGDRVVTVVPAGDVVQTEEVKWSYQYRHEPRLQ